MADERRRRIVLPEDEGARYTLAIRVRQYEIDVLGHVNNAVYLNYLEQAAVEHADSMGFTRERLAELGGLFVVRRHEIDYLGAAVAGDDLRVTTWVESYSGARAIRCYEIVHAGSGRRLIAARTVWAWIDERSMAPRPVPRAIIEALAAGAGQP
ncbi:MAG TPA: thioesterase family protein [Chloroflexota bacterium]|jgi:acyl-CoA thioester hydrolase|nr:thioesterase family protein [Chloroflexota bacterium]